MAENTRDLALFNLAIDSKLRGCDLVKLKVSDISQGGAVQTRAQIFQQKLNAQLSLKSLPQAVRSSITGLRLLH